MQTGSTQRPRELRRVSSLVLEVLPVALQPHSVGGITSTAEGTGVSPNPFSLRAGSLWGQISPPQPSLPDSHIETLTAKNSEADCQEIGSLKW